MEMKTFTALLAEDDDDDLVILKALVEAIGCRGEFKFVNSGNEVLDYLTKQGTYADVRELPNLIVLDLNISEKWRDTLKKIKSEPVFDRIPVVVLTASVENGGPQCFDLQADAFVTKRMEFGDYLEALRSALEPFCKEAMKLPDRSTLPKKQAPG
jgi:CheY-like chemotaxis protein